MFGNFVDQFWPATVDGLSLGAIYALVALGYTMVYGVLRLINFAHSEIFMIGTVATLFTVTHIGISAPLGGLALIGMVIAARPGRDGGLRRCGGGRWSTWRTGRCAGAARPGWPR